MATVNKAAFERVCRDLADRDLTFADIGEVFGSDFWEMLVIALMDSQDAARAIQSAMSRLKAGE